MNARDKAALYEIKHKYGELKESLPLTFNNGLYAGFFIAKVQNI